MSGRPDGDRRAARRSAAVEEILAAAWELGRERGLTGFSMRDLGQRVGMRAQSLYSYFASKHDLYDAMFASANRAFADWMRGGPGDAEGGDVVGALAATARRFFAFCVEDPVRHQLLFQRTVPEFVPSPASLAVAQEAYDVSVARLRSLGVDGADLDLVTAVMAGLAAQQLANDPGGDRWERLVDRATSMLLREVVPAREGSTE
ncbi:MAG TPA: TetR/AcrR family transcriptional regulator [Acidimicrobiales bacterium]|jgi:AcrR family transcriptional regulator